MTEFESERVTCYFSAASRDATPVGAGQLARVFYVSLSSDPQVTELCGRVLSTEELDRAGRFSQARERDLFIQRRAFRRYCAAQALCRSLPLSGFTFGETETGCPHLEDHPEMRFSFASSSQGFIGAWSSAAGLGVDIEDTNRELDIRSLASAYFSSDEARLITLAHENEGRMAFFKLWCLKEAALKSIAEGLPYGLDAFEFSLEPSVSILHAPSEYGGHGKFEAYLLEPGDACGALIIRQGA